MIALRNVAALVLIFAAAGCTSGLDKAKQSVTVAAKVFEVGADELSSADEAVKAALQVKFDAGSITQDEALAQFKNWVAKRTKVALALSELKHAVALAGLGISAYEAGQAKDYAAVMIDLAKAVSEALAALSSAGVKVL